MNIHSRYRPCALLASMTLLWFFPVLVVAQSNSVQIFDFCDFEGDAAEVVAGDHPSMRSLGFANDRISSIRVPDGVEVRIFEDDDFKGDFATINGDIRCFDRFWDDRVSSLKVIDTRPLVETPIRQSKTVNRRSEPSTVALSETEVTAANVAQVVFDRSVLEELGQGQWRLNRPRQGVTLFNEVDRERSSVLLQSQTSSERIRIDFFTNDVSIVFTDGRSERYPISRAFARQANVKPRPQRALAFQSTPKILRLKNRCFSYRAYTKGGVGGVRVFGALDFTQFSRSPTRGRVCIDQQDTLELQKNNPSTDVFIEIDGSLFRFAPNEAHDVFKNTWYRRLTQLVVDGG